VETLKKDSEFNRVYSKGKHHATPRLVMNALKRWNKPTAKFVVDPTIVRYGLSVSKKVGNAVVRNKLRRRLKEIFRLNAGRFLQGYDIVVVGRATAATASYAELERDLLYLAGKLHILFNII